MPRYFIEVPHSEETVACVEAIYTFLHTGSHFLTNAEWGCKDGEHKAWIILEDVKDKEQARLVVPPQYRAEARITELTRFSREEIDAIVAKHRAESN